MKSRGFSFIELMVAMAILAIAVTGIAHLHFSTAHMNSYDADRIECFKIANQTMENLLSMDITKIREYDYRHPSMSSYQNRAFTAVNNEVLTVSTSNAEGLTEDDYDLAGLPIPSSDVSEETYNLDYEPKPFSGSATSRITISDLNWSGSIQAILIQVEVPEFGVRLSAVKTNAPL